MLSLRPFVFPSQPLKFVASEIMLELRSGYLNFDFLGSFYDYDTAWDGKNSDNKDDNFNERVIGSFWIIGNSFIFCCCYNLAFYSLQKMEQKQLCLKKMRQRQEITADIGVMMIKQTHFMQSD